MNLATRLGDELILVIDAEVRCWVDNDDRATGEEPPPLEAGEVWPEGRLDAEAPDHLSYYEATGNEGASLTRAYRRAAVVIWPARTHDAVVAQRGIEAVVALLVTRSTRECRESSSRNFRSMYPSKVGAPVNWTSTSTSLWGPSSPRATDPKNISRVTPSASMSTGAAGW